MPKKYFMTWEKARCRWRKMHKGRVYTVSCDQLGMPATKDASWQAANAWWLRKAQELHVPVLDEANARLAQALEATPLEALRDLMEKGEAARQMLTILRTAAPDKDPATTVESLEEGIGVPLDLLRRLMGFGNTANHYTRHVASEDEMHVNLDALAAQLSPAPVDPERAVSHHVGRWKALQMGTTKSNARKKMNCHMLDFFAQFLGSVDIDAIDEAKWQEFYSWLAAKPLDEGYKGRILRTARNFVTYLFEMNLLDAVPRNLGSRLLIFRQKRKKVNPLPDEAVRRFFGEATGQTRLHVLLCLNCGMTAQDVSDLQDDQVNWVEGTITRKRSKTEDHEDVPEVTYKLWPSTFALLKEYRSGRPTSLLTKTGQPWIQEEYDGSKYRHSDSIASNFKTVSRKAKVKVSPKQLRTTAASKLAEHPKFKFYAQYYLGQSPKTVADKHYVKPSDAEFFRALAWLEGQFDLQV